MPLRPIDRSYKVNPSLSHVCRRPNAVQSAINVLHSRRRPERPSVRPGSNSPGLSRIPDAQGKPDLKGTPSIVGMKQWLHRIGHSVCLLEQSRILLTERDYGD